MEPIIINHFSRRNQFIKMLADRGAKIGVEVGTDHGQYAQQLCAGILGLKLYCVDPWVAYTEGNEVHTQEEMNQIYEEALERTKAFNCIPLRETSMGAVNRFDDDSLDFVFVDGNHSYDFVLEDIREWYRKVKPGGIIAGHDYKIDPENDYGVIEAVNVFVAEKNIAPWFILHAGGSLVDCWMIIKQP